MKTLQFTTNVKCAGCVATLAQKFDNNENITSWNIDLQNPQKVLTIQTDLSADEIIKIVVDAGYEAREV